MLRKGLAVLMAGIMAVSLAGCGGSAKEGGAVSESEMCIRDRNYIVSALYILPFFLYQ